MIQSRKFVAAALILGIALILAGLLAAPFNASARAAAGHDDALATDRIGGAFATIAGMRPSAELTAAAAHLSKGDLGVGCAEAVWPNIDASCLLKADGSRAQRVRTVTIGYQADPNTTVLVRVPTGDTAQR